MLMRNSLAITQLWACFLVASQSDGRRHLVMEGGRVDSVSCVGRKSSTQVQMMKWGFLQENNLFQQFMRDSNTKVALVKTPLQSCNEETVSTCPIPLPSICRFDDYDVYGEGARNDDQAVVCKPTQMMPWAHGELGRLICTIVVPCHNIPFTLFLCYFIADVAGRGLTKDKPGSSKQGQRYQWRTISANFDIDYE